MGSHSGPNVARDSLYNYHVCTTSGTFTPNFSGNVEVLVVAGGGGGGMDMGGGGGGGGVLSSTSYAVTAGTPITVTVGAGGVGAPAGGPPNNRGHQFWYSATQGGNSVFGSLTAIGGGFGGSSYFGYTPNNGYGGSGGSGGGASGYSDGSSGRAGTGTAGQGYDGGGSVGQYYSGGGGGAGGAGSNGSAANGGDGITNSILGKSYYWGGGGGGSGYSSGVGGNGGKGGGGGGSPDGIGDTTGYKPARNAGRGGGGNWANTPGGNGGQFTGGGGGGGMHYCNNNQGGNGGSGIVIIRYLKSLGTSTFNSGSTSAESSLILSLDAGNLGKGSAVEVLAVAGGGGGGMDMGGGGGGGQAVVKVLPVQTNVPVQVTVGGGGAGSPGPYAGNPPAGSNGGDTVFGTLVVKGGGGGGSGHYHPDGYAGKQGQDGGNAGGDSPLWGRNKGYGQPSSYGGYPGGSATTYADGWYGAGGGGGNSRPGGGGRYYGQGGSGGDGLYSDINGTGYYWGGGGGGSSYANVAGNGGAGGGGGGSEYAGYTAGSGGSGLNVGTNGTAAVSANGGNGGANTGGGGGGGSHWDSDGGNGGSGIVIVRYYGSQKATGGTITSANGYTVHTFTSSGTFTPTGFLNSYDSSSSSSQVINYGIAYDSTWGGNWVFAGTSGTGLQVAQSNSSYPTSPYLNLKTSQGGQGFTAIVWARSTGGLGGWRKLFAHGDGDNYIELYQNTSGYYHQDGCGSTLYVDGVQVSNDAYYMVNTGWHCYAATNSNSGTLTNPAGLLTIGNEPNLTAYPWIGNIAVVNYYNRVLTAAELLQNFQALRGRFSI